MTDLSSRALVAQTSGNGQQGLVVEDVGARFVVSLAQSKRRMAELQEFIKEAMVEGVDFGQIPGTPKPTLLKPGAEKLLEIYGLAPLTEVASRVEDWNEGFFHYETKTRLVHKSTGVIVAEGIGSCNSREKRYRNQDAYTLVNTILKMAKKRSLVDAALSATRSSGLFTQDVEDWIDPEEPPRVAPKAGASGKTPPPAPKVTRAQVEAAYRRELDKADVLSLPAEHFDPKWPDQTLGEKYRQLKARVKEREDSEARKAGASVESSNETPFEEPAESDEA